MLLLIITPIALLVGLALGGRLDNLAQQSLRFGPLALTVFVAQWLLVHIPGTAPDPWLGAALTSSAALLLGFVLPNLRLPGFKLLLVGVVLNVLVMGANGGFMPIAPDSIRAVGHELPPVEIGQRIPLSKNIYLPAEAANLGVLGDHLVVIPALRFVASAGDLFLAAGVAWFVIAALEPKRLRVPTLLQRGALRRLESKHIGNLD